MPQTHVRRNQLVEAHLYLADVIARDIAHRLPPCFEVDDLIQAGRLGLLDAAEKFRRKFKVPFKSYAAIRVRGAILSSVRRRQWTDSTADELDLEAIDTPAAPQIEEGVAASERGKILAFAVRALPTRDQTLIDGHYREGSPLVEVGRRKLRVGQSRVCQLHTRAIGRLRREAEMLGLSKAA